METLTLRYKLEPEEAAVAAVDHSPAVRTSAKRTQALGAAGILLGLLMLTQTAIAFALLAVGVLIFSLGTRFSILRRSRWVYERTPFFSDPVTAVADEQGVRFTSADNDLWYRWSSYDAAHNAANGVALVMRGGTSVRWIPSRAFAGADQQAAWFVQAYEGIRQARQPVAPN
jgi:hypothetical protein